MTPARENKDFRVFKVFKDSKVFKDFSNPKDLYDFKVFKECQGCYEKWDKIWHFSGFFVPLQK